MKNTTIHKSLNRVNLAATLLILSIAFSALIFLFTTQQAKASSSSNLSGYAWSDNIGWISFNCSDQSSCATSSYGVNIDTAGNLSGYAWSDNIGWISFNSGDTSSCPGAPCAPTLNITTGEVAGWARALSADGNGWDGWIRLSQSSTYGTTLSGNTFSGYSWGSDVVGWISWGGFSGLGGVIYNPPPAASGWISVIPCVILPNNSTCDVIITWESNNFIGTPNITLNSSATPLSTSASSPVGGLSVPVSEGTNTFTLEDDGGSVIDSVVMSTSCQSESVWAAGSCVPLPVITLNSTANLIRSGKGAEIEITVTSGLPLTCTMRDGGTTQQTVPHNPALTPTTTHTLQTRNLTSAQVISVTCSHLDPTYSLVTRTESYRVSVVPTVQEI